MAASILTWAGLSDTHEEKPAEIVSVAAAATLDTRVLPAALGSDDPAILSFAYRLFLSEMKKHGDSIPACALRRSATDLKYIALGAKGDARNAGAVILGDLLQDWSLAYAQGCDVAQGYFIARPMPPDAVFPWTQNWRTRTDIPTAAKLAG